MRSRLRSLNSLGLSLFFEAVCELRTPIVVALKLCVALCTIRGGVFSMMTGAAKHGLVLRSI